MLSYRDAVFDCLKCQTGTQRAVSARKSASIEEGLFLFGVDAP